MKRNDHIKYIKDLTALQDSEGKRVSAGALRAIGKIYKASGGNLTRFIAMIQALRPALLKELVMEVKRSQLKAKKLGVQFGKQKLNGGD